MTEVEYFVCAQAFRPDDSQHAVLQSGAVEVWCEDLYREGRWTATV